MDELRQRTHFLSFKERAKRHQIKFREEVLKVGYNGYETILTDADAQKGLIFYDGFKILEAAQARYPYFKLNQACYSNMLRSEHVPFNFFIPLSKKLDYAREVLNRFMGGVISMIYEIRIEYAPDPEKALKDKTSFDVFVEYRHKAGGYGIIGIEVKYTEREYKLVRNSKEDIEVNNETSIYNTLTKKLGLYKTEFIPELKKDKYRQVWRNQLLGESMTRKNRPDSKYEHFTSVLFYPEGNDHFRELIPAYKSSLNPGHENSFIGINYEEFIDAALGISPDEGFVGWLNYLKDRYIVTN